MRRNREVIEPKGHATDIFSDWAGDYLRERAKAKKPFFLYLAYNAPHFPIEPPDDWPAQIKAGSRSDYAGLNFDLFPTFIELAGGKPSAELDAVSLVPVLEGGTLAAPRDLYFVRREGGSQYGGKSYEAIIRGDWKLMQNDPFSPLELYNLKADPQEKNNLAATNKTKFNELSTALRQHIQRGGATPWQKVLAK